VSDSINPLLTTAGPIAFDRIRPEHVVPGITALLAELGAVLDELEATARPTWEGVVEPLERIEDRINVVWGTVWTFMTLKNSDQLRTAIETVQPEVVAFTLRRGQSRPIFGALEKLRNGPGWNALDGAQRRIVLSLLREARHSGVGLEGAARARFNQIEARMAELGTRFSNHLLDETRAFSLTLRDRDEVSGLPDRLLQLAAQAAREAGDESATAESGPWRILLSEPYAYPVIAHADRRELRETIYRALVTRASQGERDNGPIVRELLRLRKEQANLIGFGTFADLSIDAKMAESTSSVNALLEELRQVAYPAARTDLENLTRYANENTAGAAGQLAMWDQRYWAEKLQEEQFGFREEELRPYFPFPHVLDGLFTRLEELFGIIVKAADGKVPVWDPFVRYFEIFDESGEKLASFYLDALSRPQEKQGGAWQAGIYSRSRALATEGESVRRPMALIVCNQTPPLGDKPPLMSFSEVTTLFHEFGHALHHLLTTVDHGMASGTSNVEWDAIELPSMFMENWCYHPPTLKAISRHIDTGESLSDDLIAKIRAARAFRAGSQLLRQLHYSLTDLELHHRYDPNGPEDPQEVERRLAQRTTVLPPIPEDRMLASFSHIFAGGYAAGYYSYTWASVLAADAFSAFEEAGLDDDAKVAEVGRRFRDTVLALGGGTHPMEVFRAFRGREPRTEALLRQLGLIHPA
jgi:oligopeptidase A